ncbi:MAG: homocysteine S-methyltransferase family protein, partial [Oscillospiraceae bacterium]|nr:homocysteine S-methyltransferase family protein [Oscillospiraceae bacterium]
MKLLDCINQGLFYLDGGTGTWLQRQGLQPGELPEIWNLRHPDRIIDLHRQYYEAGSHMICTNTFGANALKYDGQTPGLFHRIDINLCTLLLLCDSQYFQVLKS